MMVRLLPEDDWDFSGTPDEKEVTFMMDVAARVSGESHDYKTKVGAVIAKDRNILAYGYNGTVTGLDNTMRDKEGICLDTVVHAEQNAIAKLARSTQSGIGATAYCTLFPCMSCALSLVQAGISTIIYRDDHKGNRATGLLLDSNIQLFKYFKEQ